MRSRILAFKRGTIMKSFLSLVLITLLGAGLAFKLLKYFSYPWYNLDPGFDSDPGGYWPPRLVVA
jgi:hypothetical protein